jgi:hypothetical protein
LDRRSNHALASVSLRYWIDCSVPGIGTALRRGSDTVFVEESSSCFSGAILYQRSWWASILDRLGRGSDEERRAIMEQLAADDLAVAWRAGPRDGVVYSNRSTSSSQIQLPTGFAVYHQRLFLASHRVSR